MSTVPKVEEAYWMGRLVTELTREELLEAINHVSNEIRQLRADRDRWFKAGDPLKYLMNGD